MIYESPEDIETDTHWVNCGSKEGCNWWVHTILQTSIFPTMAKVKKNNRCMGNKALLLQKTHAQGRKICWNKELNKKSILQLGETGKMSCSILKLKKKIKKRTDKLTWDSLW